MALRRNLIAVPATLALWAAATAATAAIPGATVRGEELVMRNCTQCHAVDRPGGSPNSAAPPLHRLYQYVKMSDLALALKQGLLAKHPAMPEFRFTPQEIDDVMTYLRSIQQQAEAIAAPVR